MAKDQRNVEAITPMEEDFAKWYTDICLKAELVDYSSVKGFTILRPYGYAIWENIQKLVDAELKRTNHVNVAMPVLIPENLLKKEGELVEGFAPEAAWVTMGGSEKLEERMALRPTSETMFCDHWSHVLHSYRELPMLYNQWCSVVRWEKTTRPFLRTREFWWQEGHTIHETAEEAIAETEMILNIYADLCRDKLAMPVVRGRKTDKEKFAGAEATYTVECMMKDRKALQGATSHYFGDKFSRAYDVTFTGRDNKLQYPFQTSWGVTTRLVGAIIMTHGDNHGLVLPPAIAPIQVAVIPVAQHKPGVLDAAAAIRDRLTAAGLRVKMDDSDQSPGWKFAQYEMKGVPVRVEIGPRDMEKEQCCIARRDTGEKTFVPLRPGLIINNPHRPLPEPQRAIFEANDWQIVEAAQPAHTEPPALCYSSVWLSMNCLVLDPKTVIVEASEVHQQEQMDKLGMNVIPCDLRDAYPFGGGLHCSTADVYREGECLDYFPNRVEDPTLVRPEMWK